jgi:hypothetical protein
MGVWVGWWGGGCSGDGLQRLSGLIWFWDGVEQLGGGFRGELAQGGGGPRELALVFGLSDGR